MATTKEALSKGSYYWFAPDQLFHAEEGHDLYDPRSNDPPDPQLMALLKAHGWIGPAIQAHSEDGELIIADGRRRHRAVEALVKAGCEIRCKVEITKGDAFDSMLVGNLGRRDETPLQLAAKARRLEANGFKIKEIAKKFGATEQWIRDLLALADAPRDVKDAVKSGDVPATMAKDLAKLPKETRAEVLADGPIKGASGKKRIKNPSAPASRKVPAATIKSLYADLQEKKDTTGFEAAWRALLALLLGDDPEGKAIKNFVGGSGVYEKVRQL